MVLVKLLYLLLVSLNYCLLFTTPLPVRSRTPRVALAARS